MDKKEQYIKYIKFLDKKILKHNMFDVLIFINDSSKFSIDEDQNENEFFVTSAWNITKNKMGNWEFSIRELDCLSDDTPRPIRYNQYDIIS